MVVLSSKSLGRDETTKIFCARKVFFSHKSKPLNGSNGHYMHIIGKIKTSSTIYIKTDIKESKLL